MGKVQMAKIKFGDRIKPVSTKTTVAEVIIKSTLSEFENFLSTLPEFGFYDDDFYLREYPQPIVRNDDTGLTVKIEKINLALPRIWTSPKTGKRLRIRSIPYTLGPSKTHMDLDPEGNLRQREMIFGVLVERPGPNLLSRINLLMVDEEFPDSRAGVEITSISEGHTKLIFFDSWMPVTRMPSAGPPELQEQILESLEMGQVELEAARPIGELFSEFAQWAIAELDFAGLLLSQRQVIMQGEKGSPRVSQGETNESELAKNQTGYNVEDTWSKDELIKQLPKLLPAIRQYHKNFSPPTAIEIIKAIPKGWEAHMEEGGRWGAGFISRFCNVEPTTISRYLSALRKAGVRQIDGVEI